MNQNAHPANQNQFDQQPRQPSIRQKINEYLPTREYFHEWLLRQKFFIPDVKCNIMTCAFMHQIATNEVFMPKIDAVRPVTIPKPPSRPTVQAELVEVL